MVCLLRCLSFYVMARRAQISGRSRGNSFLRWTSLTRPCQLLMVRTLWLISSQSSISVEGFFSLAGTHHSKMVIAFYPEGVRVAVTTANFIYIDWNNKSQVSWNAFHVLSLLVWEINIQVECWNSLILGNRGLGFRTSLWNPLMPKVQQPSPTTLGGISWCIWTAWEGPQKTLQRLASYPNNFITIPRDLFSWFIIVHHESQIAITILMKELRRYDFSSANVKLVTSVPGYHKNEDLQSFGRFSGNSKLKLCCAFSEEN